MEVLLLYSVYCEQPLMPAEIRTRGCTRVPLSNLPLVVILNVPKRVIHLFVSNLFLSFYMTIVVRWLLYPWKHS